MDLDTTQPLLKRRSFLGLTGAAAGTAIVPWGSGMAAHAATGDGLLDSTIWQNATVLIDDPCDNLQTAGWSVKSVESGGYAMDAPRTPSNPFGVQVPAVPAGRYRLRADEIGLPSPGSYAQMLHALPAGQGPWRLDLDMNIRDIPYVADWPHTRGFTLTVTLGGFTHNYTLINRNELLLWSAGGGVGRRFDLPIPFDDTIHSWSWVFDGIDTTTLLLDGTPLATFRNVRYAGTASTLLLRAFAPDIASGAVDVEFDRITLRQLNTSAVPLGDGKNLDTAGWEVDPATATAYITDAARSSGTVAGMLPVVAGDVLAYGAAGAAPRTAHRSATDHADTWGFTTSLKIAAIAAGATPADGGLDVTLDLGEHRYLVRFGGEQRLAILNPSTGAARHVVDGGFAVGDGKFHQWHFGADSHGRLFIQRDGTKIIDGVSDLGDPATGAAGVAITVDPSQASSGHTEAYFARFAATGDVMTAWHDPRALVSLLPSSSASQLDGIVHLRDVDPLELAAGALSLVVTVSRADHRGDPTGSPLDTITITPNANDLPFSLAAEAGELVLTVALTRGTNLLTEDRVRVPLAASSTVVPAGSTAQLAAGESVVFTAVDECRTADGSTPWQAGWSVGTFAYDGTDSGGAFLDAATGATPLVVPVTLQGWLSVTVGYVTGCEGLTADLGGGSVSVNIPGTGAFDPANAFGARAVGEAFVTVGNQTGQQLSIAPPSDGQARIAYVRLTGLTSDEIAVASAGPDSQPKRVFYNNDGYSGFYSGQYNTPAELTSRAIDHYANSDTEALTFQAGVTMFHNYDSAVSGTPYAEWQDAVAADPSLADKMRAGDQVAMDAILGYVQRQEVPAEVLAARGDQIGVKVFSGLRMNAFYNPAQYPWMNGNRFDEFTAKHVTYYGGGSYAYGLSHAHPEFRNFLRDLLAEHATFSGTAGVDLDFCRYPGAVGWEPVLMDAYQAEYGVDPRLDLTIAGGQRWQQFRADAVTQFMRELRTALGDHVIMVRIPRGRPLSFGLDVATWVAEGLIDILVPSNVSIETFWSGLEYWTDLVDGTDILLYGGTTGTLGGTDMSKEDEDSVNRGFPSRTGHTMMNEDMYQERAAEFYRAGFDGLYIFNAWSGVASLNRVGDRAAVARWRTFAFPAQWRQGFVTAQASAVESAAELAALVDHQRAAGALRESDGRRLTGAARAAGELATRGATSPARGRLTDFLELVAEIAREDRASTATTAELRVAAHRVLSSL